MSKKVITKKVACAICGKKGTVKIDSNGKILSKNFIYYGKINLNFKTEKYLYEVVFDKKGHAVLKNGKITFKKILNKTYDKNAKPKYIEEWVCKKDAEEDKDRIKQYKFIYAEK